jgi:peptidoglycan/xylan/chitin deacetylase (PgdA/CDA1 family)
MRFLMTFLACLFLFGHPMDAASEGASARGVPVLLYHRFGPTVTDSMTVTTEVFESHLRYLQENRYTVLDLRQVVDMVSGRGNPPAGRCVALVADDGHRSIYSDALPLIKKYRIPMTLFIYPSAVSNAPYAMTWDQLRELKETGLFDLQSHTYWHPNFKKEREKLDPAEFDKLLHMQLTKSREKLEREMGRKVDLLAWPFGIYDSFLMEKAAASGYAAAFTIERHPAARGDHPMAIPRYLMADRDRGKVFEAILNTNVTIAKVEKRNGKND